MDYYVLDRVRLIDGGTGVIDALTDNGFFLVTADGRRIELSFQEIDSLILAKPSDVNYNDAENFWADKIGGKYPWEMGYIELIDYFNRDYRRSFEEVEHMVNPFSPDVTSLPSTSQVVEGMLVATPNDFVGPLRIVQPGHHDRYGDSVLLKKEFNWMLTRTGHGLTMSDIAMLVHQPNIQGLSIAATDSELMYMIMPSKQTISDEKLWLVYLSVIDDLNQIDALNGPIVMDKHIEGNVNEANVIVKMVMDRLGWTYRVSQFDQLKSETFDFGHVDIDGMKKYSSQS